MCCHAEHKIDFRTIGPQKVKLRWPIDVRTLASSMYPRRLLFLVFDARFLSPRVHGFTLSEGIR